VFPDFLTEHSLQKELTGVLFAIIRKYFIFSTDLGIGQKFLQYWCSTLPAALVWRKLSGTN